MSLRTRALVVAAVLTGALVTVIAVSTDSRAGRSELWVTVDKAELAHIVAASANGDSLLKNVEVRAVRSNIAILRLNDLQMEELSRAMHDKFHKCSGYIAFQTEDEALRSADETASVDPQQQLVSYTIDNQATVTPMLALTSEPQNRQVIIDLAAFPNRRHNQQSGLDSANWIYNKWTALAAGRSDTTVDRDAIAALRSRAAQIVPAVADAPEVSSWAGVRPGTPDDAPMIGPTGLAGVHAALGCYRNGILFTPAVADLVASQMLDGKVSAEARAFAPLRFDKNL